jgi:hypothetical protein
MASSWSTSSVRFVVVAGDRDDKSLPEQALDGLSRLGMLGLLLAGPAALLWAVRRLLRRKRS